MKRMHTIFVIHHCQTHYEMKGHIILCRALHRCMCLQRNQLKQESFPAQLGIELYSISDKQASGCQHCEILYITT